MKRIMKQILTWALILVLVGSLAACGDSDPEPSNKPGESSDNNLEAFLSDAAGDWYAFGNLEDRKVTINADGTFVADYDSDTTDEGTISYSEDNEMYAFEGKEQGYYGNILGDDVLLFWGNRYYRADQSIEFGQLNGKWFFDGDPDAGYYEIEDGQWTLMSVQGDGRASSESGHVEYRGGDEYPLHLYENVDDDEPNVAFKIEGEDELIVKDGGSSYVRLDAEVIQPTDSEDDEKDGKYWDIDDVEESELGIKYQYAYFGNGDITNGRLYINDDGTFVVINPASEKSFGTYSEDLDTGTIKMTMDDSGDSFELKVEDGGAVLTSEEGDHLVCVVAQYLPDKNGDYPDAYYNHPIPPESFYYQNGDRNSGSLLFFNIEAVTTKSSADAEEMLAYYSINGDVLSIGWIDSFDGFTLTIEDGGKTLVAENGERFLLDE